VVSAGKLLLINTASGVVGADLSELIGIVLLGLFEAALAEQAGLSQEQRRRYLVLIDEFQVYRGANYQGMLAELRKYGGSFALATQSLAYLDRLERTLRATVLANIDHLFAFHMAGEDARLLHELDGIGEDDITNLDDFQCYVKLSLHGHRLPVFSLNLDAPPRPDEDMVRLVRLRSQQRDGRPAGMVDDLIRQIQARQRGAAPTTLTTQRAYSRREEDETAARRDDAEAETGSARRRKKRGSGGQNKTQDEVAPSHLYLMYQEEDESASSPEREDGERDASHA
ncbi:MAG TPA: type IV secretory system conjugative DNA transfer family protein, partial [Ktedonobacteraceae bacterium]